MTITLASTTPRLADLVAGVRDAVSTRSRADLTVRLVADQLRQQLPGPEILTAEQRLGDPRQYATHPLHIEPDGSFTIVALVWRPGQRTRIHDHISWCVFGVIQGVEHEELFDRNLTRLGTNDNNPGDVSGFAPPGDIHRVRNVGDGTAISLHIYGANLAHAGSSVRRYYD
jgi:3-mercaptopropionate dioxygenase